MFEKTLTDVVKGIRSSKRDTALYISQCIAEIKQELNSTDLYSKANALNKLTFLQMMGYDMSWASFSSIEVMSSPRFAHKRIGYLAACQGFTQDTDVILLTTNLLQKELRGAVNGGNMYEAGLAVNCISNIVTEDLARDLLPEITALISHQQPYLRKKIILCLFKVFLKYPQGLRLTFDKIQQCLEDPNPSVVSCAVNVITELSDTNPNNYLHLAPAFFSLLTQSQNNWMLIKVVKLLGSLVPEEPRLARKLLEPLAQIVQSTQAKSLKYEACYTISLCLPYCRKADGSMPSSAPQIIQLCGHTFREFLADKDQNLKYLGLVGFCSLVDTHPKILAETQSRELILGCLSDEDVTIRTRALDLLRGIASRKKLPELVQQLMSHVEAASGQYQKDMIRKILELCSADKYALLQDFQWFLDILLNLSTISPPDLGPELEKQINDVALRVLPVRAYAVEQCTKVLLEKRNILPEVLSAVAWILGEYSDLLQHSHHALVEWLLKPANTDKVTTATQAIFVQAALKIFAASTNKASSGEMENCVRTLTLYLPVYMQSLDVEVQERSFTGLELLKSLHLTPSALDTPGLTQTSDDEGEQDVLGMGPSSTIKALSKSSSLASRCKSAATTLNYVLKPEPMKPISAKAQRKKRQNPLGGITVEFLEAPLDMSVFAFLEDVSNTSKPTIDQVSFTQQRPFQAPAPKPKAPMQGIGSESSLNSFQNAGDTGGGGGGDMTNLNRARASSDPFYLDTGDDGQKESNNGANRFGTIQLLDSDGEDEGKKKKKRKKKKKAKPADLSIFDSSHHSATAPPPVYDSDDEDDDDDDRILSATKPKKATKRHSGLAQIDLTKPLTENEVVLPNREHRVVPERHLQGEEEGKKKKKKKKKESKKKDNSQTPAQLPPTEVTPAGGVADLLDLSGFTSVADVSKPNHMVAPVTSSSTMMPQSTTINSAFDDLLGLESTPVPSLGVPMVDNLGPKGKKSGKKAWQKATLKTASAEGSLVDWNQVSLSYKISPQRLAANVTFKVESGQPINGLTLALAGLGEVSFGDINGSETVKFGLIKYGQPDAALDLKGHLSSGECRVTVKLTLPVTLFLSPLNVSMDSVMAELGSEQFESHSAKVTLSMDFAKAKAVITNFFNAFIVDDSGAMMLASQSMLGAKVYVLVKEKNNQVKIDIKSNNGNLSKGLSGDVKKLIL